MNDRQIRSSSSAAVVLGFVTLAAALILPGELSAARNRTTAAERSPDERRFLEEEAREVRRQALAPDEHDQARQDSRRVSIPLLGVGAVLIALGCVGRVWSHRHGDQTRPA